jgi:hypothetical protein
MSLALIATSAHFSCLLRKVFRLIKSTCGFCISFNQVGTQVGPCLYKGFTKFGVLLGVHKIYFRNNLAV